MVGVISNHSYSLMELNVMEDEFEVFNSDEHYSDEYVDSYFSQYEAEDYDSFVSKYIGIDNSF